jgi:hypothetical protein
LSALSAKFHHATQLLNSASDLFSQSGVLKYLFVAIVNKATFFQLSVFFIKGSLVIFPINITLLTVLIYI